MRGDGVDLGGGWGYSRLRLAFGFCLDCGKRRG